MCKPVKILHVVSRMGRGGAEMRTVEILRHIDRREYCSHLCALSGQSEELDKQVLALGGRVHLMRRGLVAFPRRFRALLREHRFDVVHSQVLYYSGFILRLAAQCGVPIRAAFFRSTRDGRRSSPARRLYRKLMTHWIDRYATHIQAVSEAAMRDVWRPDWKTDPRCHVIYDGLDLTPFATEPDNEAVRREIGLPPNSPLYIHVGRMAPPKNHGRLVSIFAEVLKRQPSATLLLVGRGGGRIERDVRRRLSELEIAQRVVLGKERKDVPRLLKAADAMIFPSLWEGLPGAVLEACAAGTPVVAADLPSVREIAARLPHVHCLSLEADDATWATAATRNALPPDARSERQDAFRTIAGSAFTIDQCARQHCRAWQGLGVEPSNLHPSEQRE